MDRVFPRSKFSEKAINSGKQIKFVQMEKLIKYGFENPVFGSNTGAYYTTTEDMLVKITQYMEKGTDYIIAYTDIVDHAEHTYHPMSDEVHQTLCGIFHAINRILLPLLKKSDYNLIIMADHGHETIKVNDSVIHLDTEKLMDLSHIPPWGEPRAMFIDVDDRKEKELLSYLDKFKKELTIMDSDEAISAGLFGKNSVDERLRYRFGSHVIVPAKGKIIRYNYTFVRDKPYGQNGTHGGLCPDEMYIPIIVK